MNVVHVRTKAVDFVTNAEPARIAITIMDGIAFSVNNVITQTKVHCAENAGSAKIAEVVFVTLVVFVPSAGAMRMIICTVQNVRIVIQQWNSVQMKKIITV